MVLYQILAYTIYGKILKRHAKAIDLKQLQQRMIIVVKISFDKVVDYLLSNPMSLVTYRAPPWFALSEEIF